MVGGGFHCLQPGSGACLCKTEAFFLLSECGGAGGQERGEGVVEGEGASKWRPPALCLRFPSVGKMGATNTKTLIDVCMRALVNIIIIHA